MRQSRRLFKYNPKYERRAVAFFDFLGWRSKIKAAGKRRSQVGELRRMILQTRRRSVPRGFKMTTFSDNVVISCPIKNAWDLVFSLMGTQALCAAQGFLLRGGITSGDIIHDEEVVFGPALNRAYELESNVAIFPRIILDKKLLAMLKRSKKYHFLMPLISRDRTVHYINAFSPKAVEMMVLLSEITMPYRRSKKVRRYLAKHDIYRTSAKHMETLERNNQVESRIRLMPYLILSNIAEELSRKPRPQEFRKLAWVYDELIKNFEYDIPSARVMKRSGGFATLQAGFREIFR